MLPGWPRLNGLVMGALNVPGLGRGVRRLVYPSEAYEFWDHYAPGFSGVTQDLRKDDVLPSVRTAVREAMERAIGPGRSRLVVKITGWPRIGFLKEIFPDARFVAVSRDGRAVAVSGFLTPWFNGWRGPENWAWGRLTREQRERWEAHNRSFLVLAGLAWEKLMKAQREASRRIPDDDFLEIRYEDLCRQPLRTFRSIAEFGSLRWTLEFERVVRGFTFQNGNDKWRRLLLASQQKMLSDCLSDALREYGFAGRSGPGRSE